MADPDPMIVGPAPEQAPQDNGVPTVAPEGTDFLQTVVPEPSRDSVRNAAVSILAKGADPADGEGQETGLVVGYVQSGKKMSVETGAALVRDDSFQMGIVVAGTSNPLF